MTESFGGDIECADCADEPADKCEGYNHHRRITEAETLHDNRDAEAPASRNYSRDKERQELTKKAPRVKIDSSKANLKSDAELFAI